MCSGPVTRTFDTFKLSTQCELARQEGDLLLHRKRPANRSHIGTKHRSPYYNNSLNRSYDIRHFLLGEDSEKMKLNEPGRKNLEREVF